MEYYITDARLAELRAELENLKTTKRIEISDRLKKAKELGDQLIVVLARDSTIRKVKGFEPKYSEKQRRENIREIPYVDKAIIGSSGEDKYQIIEEINPDVIALGYDQDENVAELKELLAKRGLKTEVVRLGAYKEHQYKSSKLRQTQFIC